VAPENLWLICMVKLLKDRNLDKLNTNHVKECLDKQLRVCSERLREEMNRKVKKSSVL
jgi:hypothetical protein